MIGLEDEPRAWIYFFCVTKKERRQGIGNRLLKKVENKLPKEYSVVFVDFESKDKSAEKFYEKNGFKKRAKIKDWFGLNHKGLIYEKKNVDHSF